MDITELLGSGVKQEELAQMSPLTLAFVGDGVHTLYVRNHVIKGRIGKIGDYHNLCAKYCKAQAQANALDKVMQDLTEKEEDVVRRARNVKTHNIAKNSDFQTYKKATSFEALVGYLYLTENFERLLQILKISIQGE